jgi:ferritin-like metal-binding protein YciE
MADLNAREAVLVKYLNEAFGKEKQLETVLDAQIGRTSNMTIKKRLREHLKETKAHGRLVARRIKALGGEAETVHVPGPDAVVKGARGAKAAVQKAAAAAQAPLHAVRGTGEQERMLKNAQTEYADEAQEIATYKAIEALAKAVGDKETAKLARDIAREEKRMADVLIGLIAELALDVVHDQVPVSEISAAPAARQTAVKRTPAKRAAAAKRTTSRASSPKRTTSRASSATRTTSRASSAKRTTAKSR